MKVEGNPATAEVTVKTGGEPQTFTLTDLAWEGDLRVAQVHDEGPNSPPVGRFEGTGGQGEVKGTLVSGHSVYKLNSSSKAEARAGSGRAPPGAPVGAQAAPESLRLLGVDALAESQGLREHRRLAALDQGGEGGGGVGADRLAAGEVLGEDGEVVVVAEQFG